MWTRWGHRNLWCGRSCECLDNFCSGSSLWLSHHLVFLFCLLANFSNMPILVWVWNTATHSVLLCWMSSDSVIHRLPSCHFWFRFLYCFYFFVLRSRKYYASAAVWRAMASIWVVRVCIFWLAHSIWIFWEDCAGVRTTGASAKMFNSIPRSCVVYAYII